MTRPLFIASMLFSFGVLLYYTNNLIVLTLIAILLCYVYMQSKDVLLTIFFTLIALFGMLRANVSDNSAIDLPKTNSFEAIVQNVTKSQNSTRILANFLHENCLVQMIITKEHEQDVHAGQKLIVKGELLLPEPKRNPGGFDESLYFKSKNIKFKMFPNEIVPCEITNHFAYRTMQFRNVLCDVYDKILLAKEAAIIKSMILGDKSDLDDSTKELYRIAGVYHILAISGLHISIIALFISFILKHFFDIKTSSYLTLIILILYCVMTGSSVSTVRAVIMCAVVIFSKILYRSNDLLTSMAFAMLCLLLAKPFYILDIGFQYSFGAVFGIAIFASAFKKCLSVNEKFIWLSECLSATLAASVVTNAVSALHFYYITPYSVFANMFIIPTVVVLVASGLIVGIIGLISVNVASFLSAVVFFLLKFYEMVCNIFVRLPFAKLVTGEITSFMLVSYCVMIAMLAVYLKNATPCVKKYFVFSFIFCVSIFISIRVLNEEDAVTMLDVGQGDCFVVHCAHDTFIIDGGGKRNIPLGNNTGQNVLIPYLNYKAIGYISAAFVSHSDADHIMGVIELLEDKAIGKVFLSSQISHDELYNELINAAAKHKIPIEYLSAGDSVANFECVYPEQDVQSFSNNNNTSLVLKFKYQNVTFLFTGDLEDETQIVKRDLHSDILKLAHHGSKTSTSEQFLKAVNPSIAIVSSGKNNMYGHPSKVVTDRLKNMNVPLYNTAENGSVKLKFVNGKLNITSEIKNEYYK